MIKGLEKGIMGDLHGRETVQDSEMKATRFTDTHALLLILPDQGDIMVGLGSPGMWLLPSDPSY